MRDFYNNIHHRPQQQQQQQQQQEGGKGGTGNFVIPRLFEINVRSSKSSQLKETNFAHAVHAGLMSTYGRSLTKGLSAPREASNPSTAFAMVREKHSSGQKIVNSNSNADAKR